MTRRQLARVLEDRERCRHAVEREERLECIEVDLAARQRAKLGRELELAVVRAVVQRLDPVPVAREDEAPLARVPDRDREHPAQPFRETGSPLLVRVNQDLGVAVRAERVARTLQLGHELLVVVDLAVLHDDDGAVLVRDRLVAAGEIDDREPPCREPDGAVDERAAGIRAAMHERSTHRREPAGIGGSARGGDSADPTHAALP